MKTNDAMTQLFKRHSKILGTASDEFRDGWINLIDVLCEQLQMQTDDHGAPQVEALQIKEKYGTLHFYSTARSAEQDALVDFAESLSERTCEVCGAPGKRRELGWIQTLCDQHAAAENSAR